MRGLFKKLTAVLAAAVTFASLGVAGAELKDSRLNIDANVTYSFPLQSGSVISSEETQAESSVLIFVNVNSDTSFFMLDDISNSQWAADEAVEITAVDVTDTDEETLELYRDGLDSRSVRLVEDSGQRAKAFAEAAGLDYESLSYPFTVILDKNLSIRYALEGYRSPDALNSYVQGALLDAPVPENVSAVCTEVGTAVLSWQAEPLVSGYEIWRSEEESTGYQMVFSTLSAAQTSYVDTGLETGKTYYYKMRSFITRPSDGIFGKYSGATQVELLEYPSEKLYSEEMSDGKIRVYWESVPGASGYEIYRFDSPAGPLREVISMDANAAMLQLTDKADAPSFYVVRPVYETAQEAMTYAPCTP